MDIIDFVYTYSISEKVDLRLPCNYHNERIMDNNIVTKHIIIIINYKAQYIIVCMNLQNPYNSSLSPRPGEYIIKYCFQRPKRVI